MDQLDLLLDRIRQGKTTIVVGGVPQLPPSVAALRIDCETPSTLGPLERARRLVEGLLDGDGTSAGRDDGSSPRRHVLSGDAWKPIETAFIDACNRLADLSQGRITVVLDGVDSAGAPTHEALARVLRTGSLRLPLLLVVRRPPSGSFLAVVDALGRSSTDAAELMTPTEASDAMRGERSPAAAPVPAPRAALPGGVVRVLRAGATIGTRFEAALVARLLRAPLDDVLEALQAARDAGVELRDHEDGTFSVDAELARALVASLTPSLRRRWHERLGRLLGSRPEPRDPLRAAGQLAAAGRLTDALEHRLDAVALMVRAGAVERARRALDETVRGIHELPPTGLRAGLDARVRLEQARLRWLGARADGDAPLAAILDDVLAIAAALRSPSPAVRTEVAATVAGLAYEMGDEKTLARAESFVAGTIEHLLREGAMLAAAGLINERAALLLRRDDADAAARQLAQSKALFEARLAEVPTDTAARIELADTQHLFARLPLHRARAAGRGAIAREAISVAIESAETAEKTYFELGLRRDLARAGETIARLLAERGDLDAARARFEDALRLADSIRDLTGVARITAGLAELLAEIGEPEQSVRLLQTSIDIHRQKGSAIGLVLDERTLEAIERAAVRMGDAVSDELEGKLAGLRSSIAASVLGANRHADGASA